jgi:glyoxylase-like metal-dependent hydrolase (beta-lactamase superfamily II)
MNVAIADQWFSRKAISDDITLLWEPQVTRFLRCNIWHIKGRNRDILVDTGLGICSLREAARDLFQKDLLVVATHTHYDHIGGMYEFKQCAVHRSEACGLTHPEPGSLLRDEIPADELADIEEAGYRLEGNELIVTYPYEHYNIRGFHIAASSPSWLLDEGDIIDTGDRHFQVMHLPGHSPGSIGLWEEASGTLFSGDAVYDGPLLDNLPGSNIEDYLNSMERLRRMDVKVVHGGHEKSFDKKRLHQLIDAFMKKHSR